MAAVVVLRCTGNMKRHASPLIISVFNSHLPVPVHLWCTSVPSNKKFNCKHHRNWLHRYKMLFDSKM